MGGLKWNALRSARLHTGRLLPVRISRLPTGMSVSFGTRAEELHAPRPYLQRGPNVAAVIRPRRGLFYLPNDQHAPSLRKILAARLGQSLPRRDSKPDRLLLPLPVCPRPSPTRGNTETRYRIPARRVPQLRVIAEIPNQSDLLIHSTAPLSDVQLDSLSAHHAKAAQNSIPATIVHMF